VAWGFVASATTLGFVRQVHAQAPAPVAATPAAPTPAAPPRAPASAAQAALDEEIAKLRADQEAAIAKLRADQDAAMARMQAAEDAALAALAAKQAELDRRMAELLAQQTARDEAVAAVAKKKATEPAPGVALSLLGTPVRIFGNFTLRYDYSVNSNLTDTLTNGIQANWLLMRIRFGAEFGDTGPVTGGIRLSSESSSPTVPFVPLSNAFRPAAFGVDQAWAALRPMADRDRLQLVVGRIKNPFWRGTTGNVHTQMVWDDDVNPAGAAITGQLYKSKSGRYPFTVEDTLAYMQVQSLLDTRFVGLTGVVSGVGDQLRFLSKYVDAAVSYYEWWDLNTGLSVPTSQPSQGYVSPQTASSAFLLRPGLQETNTTVNFGPSGGASAAFLDPTYKILNPTAEVHIPFKEAALGNPDTFLILDYAHNFLPNHVLTAQGNLATPNPATCASCTPVATAGNHSHDATQYDNGIGITLGARLGDKTYERDFHPMNVWISYRYVQSDATLSTFADSDLGAGTGYRGVGLGANYRIFKNMMASVQYFDFLGYPLMENRVQRMFLDLMGDF
jgi:Putative porin